MKRYVLVISFVFTLLWGTETAFAQQEIVPRDSLLADFDLFIEYLDATHPDPYTPLGGRPYFALHSQQMRQNICSEPMTKDQFITMLSDFLSELHDGHSWIHTATSAPEIDGRVPVYLRAIPDGAIVDILSQPMEKYLGMRLKAVNGVPVMEVVKKLQPFMGVKMNPMLGKNSAMAVVHTSTPTQPYSLHRVTALHSPCTTCRVLNTIFRCRYYPPLNGLFTTKTPLSSFCPATNVSRLVIWDSLRWSAVISGRCICGLQAYMAENVSNTCTITEQADGRIALHLFTTVT